MNRNLQTKHDDLEETNKLMKEEKRKINCNAEVKLTDLEKVNELNDAYIKHILKRVDNLEEINKYMEFDLENLKKGNISLKNEMKSIMNKRVVSEPIANRNEGKSGIIIAHKCEKCDFIGKNQAGLKIHSTTKHGDKP